MHCSDLRCAAGSGGEDDFLDWSYRAALEGGRIAVLDWLLDTFVDFIGHTDFAQALVDGRADSAIWVASHLPADVAASAEVYSALCSPDNWDLYDADETTAEALDWLLEHRPPATPEALAVLAEQIPEHAMDYASMSMLAVILDHGHRVDLDRMWERLEWSGSYSADLIAIVTWLVCHGARMTPDLFLAAAAARNTGVLQWLRDTAACPGYASVAHRVEQILAEPDPETRPYELARRLVTSETLAEAAGKFATFRCHGPLYRDGPLLTPNVLYS